ncbi:hypothetical protein NHH03_26480 [Stieleria sp. TO1_6]|uniref:hypothetical protein n=1 Tax=Stieleria tagensis TaxID=2956795 RepID=UPI00209AE76D|nr:hypothetical protein [Stieleria tagensis]MCO8125313.1 hypothetical protein [Stieleria tagensis]
MGFLTNCIPSLPAARAIAATALFAASALIAPAASAQEQLTPAAATPAAGSPATLSDGSQPVLVVTIGSLNKMMQDVNYITGVVGQAHFGGLFSMMAGTYGQGMDMDQPIGVLVPMIGGTPQPIVVLPTSDVRSILKRIEAQTGPIDQLDDGTLVATINGKTLYIQQNKSVAIAAQDREALKLVPADPQGLFKGMGNDYNVAVRLQVQQVPVEVRNVLIDQMRQGFESAMAKQQDADSAREMAENSIEQIERLVQEADELNFGLNIDQPNREIDVDFSFTAVGGTQLAAVYGGQQSIPSRFASVIRDDAAAYLHGATSISPEAIDQATDSVASSMEMLKKALSNEGKLSEDQLSEIDQYLGRLTEIITESLAEGKADMGVALLAGKDQFQVVLGSFVADGEKVAALAKDLAQKVPDSPDAPEFKFDLGDFNGVTMHLIEGDVPPGEEEARKVFGDKIQIHIGTAPKAVYVAMGRGSEQLLKDFITAGNSDNGGARPLGQFKLRLLPIMEFAQSVTPEANAAVSAVIAALSSSNDKGELNAVSESIPNGAASKISIREGLIKAIGAAAVAGQPQGQQPF